MRNALPSKPNLNESAIVNLDDKDGNGTHWVAYLKRGNKILYFDSFGDLGPPQELVKYFGGKETMTTTILYNTKRFQDFDSHTCGHLCLRFLLSNGDI